MKTNIISLALGIGLNLSIHSLEMTAPQAQSNDRAPAKRVVALLERCQSLGPWLNNETDKGKGALKLYAQHCVSIVEKMAEAENLDVFFLPHARFLTLAGQHMKAHHYYTLAYQIMPEDPLVNQLLAQSFKAIGDEKTAEELLEFFQTYKSEPRTSGAG